MAIVVVGLNHKTVPLGTLERLTFTPQSIPKALARLVDQDPIHEGVILSTCNRVEVYATVHRFHPAVQAVRHFLSDVSGVAQEDIASGLYTYYDATAVRHLFAVASGVDSMVIGEPQILGQVREAFLAAQEEGTARRLLSALFQRALRVGKRARTETAISRHVVSLPQAAARGAGELLGRAPGRVVVVGAGRMGELAARAFLDLGAADVVICNRTPERGRVLAEALGVRTAPFDELAGLLDEADVLASATSSPSPVIDRPLLEGVLARRTAPLIAVDLGMPRDIAADARDLDGLVLRDMEDMRESVERGARRRMAELPAVERIVDEEVEEFLAWERSLALGPAIAAIHDWAEDVRLAEVEKAVRRLGLAGDEREALEALTRGLVRKLLHRPITQIKDLVRGPDGQVYLETFQELFDLEAPDE